MALNKSLCITIESLELYVKLGVLAEERATPQLVQFNLTVIPSNYLQQPTDDIHHTIDYATIADTVAQVAEQGEFKLIEYLAHQCGHAVIALGAIDWVSVSVRKTRPYPRVGFATATIEIAKPL